MIGIDDDGYGNSISAPRVDAMLRDQYEGCSDAEILRYEAARDRFLAARARKELGLEEPQSVSGDHDIMESL